MTTILADARLGEVVSDSSVTDSDRVWLDRKVFRYKKHLYAFAGDVNESLQFMDWIRGKRDKPPKFSGSDCLQLGPDGLWLYCKSTTPSKVHRGWEAIGSGGKAAACTYEALGFTHPSLAVRIVCRNDSASRAPVRVYRLKP